MVKILLVIEDIEINWENNIVKVLRVKNCKFRIVYFKLLYK